MRPLQRLADVFPTATLNQNKNIYKQKELNDLTASMHYDEHDQTPEELVENIEKWYNANHFPQILVDTLMKRISNTNLNQYLQATPETMARIFLREYAEDSHLVYSIKDQQHAEQIKKLTKDMHDLRGQHLKY